MAPTPEDDFPCPRCRFPIVGRQSLCPKCRLWLDDFRNRVPWRYDLGSIMIFIVVCGVGLGVSRSELTVGLGISFLLIGAGTVIRAAPIFVHRKQSGKAWTVAPLFESFFIVAVLLFAAYITFAFVVVAITSSAPDPFSSGFIWIALTSGGLAASAVLFLLGRRTFPPKD